jgi:hypothetical protein
MKKKMKHLKNFESYSEVEINRILDKINDGGELTPKEKFYLENDGKELKGNIIEEIKSKVEKYGGYITMADMEAGGSPTYKEIGQEIHLVERLTNIDVEIVVYGGYKYETELDSYDVPYEELDDDILEEINELLDYAIEYGLLEEDI